MGRGRADLERAAKELPFDFSPSTDEMIRLKMGEFIYSPIELSAEILKRCRLVAENHLGRPLRRAVITVPAYFNDAQRAATELAGKLAGLEVLRLLNEPTAAALAFGFGKTCGETTIAVYDFGGGTFDISILKVKDGIFQVLATAGDTRLGGDDLDDALYRWLMKKMGKEPQQREEALAVRALVEQIKIALTRDDSLDLQLHWNNQVQWTGRIHRAELNEVIRPVIARTFECCRLAVEDSGLTLEEINEVILVGGSSRVPLVRQMVQDFFGKAPNVSMNPEEVVALGAALQASILGGEISDSLLLDVVPLSLGIETIGGLVAKIITRNTAIPCSAKEMFTTSVDNQTAVDIHVLQGERELAKDCRSLGKFKLRIPPVPAGLPKIAVHFLMDADGRLRIRAEDERTNESTHFELQPSFGLTDAEVEKMLQLAWKYSESDFKERQAIEAKNQARALIHATERSLAHPLLDPGYREAQLLKVSPVLRALKTDLEGASTEVISARSKELDYVTQDLAKFILNRSIQERLENKSLEL
jgi:molecular chaperone DnaK (HSP70)